MRLLACILPLLILVGLASCTPMMVLRQQPALATYYTITDSIPNDRDMNSFLAGYRQRKDSMMIAEVGSTRGPLTKAQPDCTIGYFVSDALLWTARQYDSLVALSTINQNALRSTYLPPGGLQLQAIYAIMPYEYGLVIAELPGSMLDSLCQHIAQNGGWPVSGLSFSISDHRAVDIQVDGAPIHPQRIYRMATSEYIMNGGSGCGFLKTAKRISYNVGIREAMLRYLSQLPGQTLDLQLENRIRYAD